MSAPHNRSPQSPPVSSLEPRPLPPALPNRPFPLKRIVGLLLTVAVAVGAAALVLPRPAGAATPQEHLNLTTDQRTAVQNAQRYLNAMATLRARFIQITSQGNMSTGEFIMARPGRMRITYDPPVPVLIVSDGTMVMYKDRELDQLSYVPLSSLPAALFIGAQVDFWADDVLLSDVSQSKGVLRLTLKRASDPMEGSLTLVFTTQPMMLKQWVVRDSQGITTTLTLQNSTIDAVLDDALFQVESRILPNTRD